MAESTKESQRAALHKAIWQIANDVRGAVDGWDFKAYVLGFLFYRFISEELARYIDEGEHRGGRRVVLVRPRWTTGRPKAPRIGGEREGFLHPALATL